MQLCSTKRVRTTSYHPCANGLVERMHRQLKAALMCHQDTWYKALPTVLLGMRASLKEDLQSSPAELVYGEPLCLPGEFISPSSSSSPDADVTSFASQLRRLMSRLQPTPATHHGSKPTFVHKDLNSSTHVFLRDDTVRPSLKPPYTGPYRIISKRDKTITITVGNKNIQVSIDRVKPAYLNNDDKSCSKTTTASPAPPGSDIPIAPPPTPSSSPGCPKSGYTTRSGRHIRFKTPFDL